MHPRRKAAILAAAILFAAPAAAQVANDAGAATQESPADSQDDTVWNVLGLFGLIGAFGLWRARDNDGYTDDPI